MQTKKEKSRENVNLHSDSWRKGSKRELAVELVERTENKPINLHKIHQK